jgi:hypothetical protein
MNAPPRASRGSRKQSLGGQRVLGWRIWKNVGFWLEAEFHAAWSIREGELLDVTPAQGSFDHILFVPERPGVL